MIIYILVIALLALAGHFKGKMDAIADEGIKGLDWANKYDLTKPGNTKHWWYLGLYAPRFPEKFPFSATALVFLTDKWHRNQFIMLHSFYLALALLWSSQLSMILILTFIVFPAMVGVFFETSYDDARHKYNKPKQ